jgi:hypothetical protein
MSCNDGTLTRYTPFSCNLEGSRQLTPCAVDPEPLPVHGADEDPRGKLLQHDVSLVAIPE